MLDKHLEKLEPLIEQDEYEAENPEPIQEDRGENPGPTDDDSPDLEPHHHSARDEEYVSQKQINQTLIDLQNVQHKRNVINQHIRRLKHKLGLVNWQIKDRILEVNDILNGKTKSALYGKHKMQETLDQMKDMSFLLRLQKELKAIKIVTLDQDIDAIDIELRNFRGYEEQAIQHRNIEREAYERSRTFCFAFFITAETLKKKMMDGDMEHDIFMQQLKFIMNKVEGIYKDLEKRWKFLQQHVQQVEWQKERIHKHKAHRKEFTDKLAKAREDQELIEELYELALKNWRMLELELEKLQVADEELPDENYENDY